MQSGGLPFRLPRRCHSRQYDSGVAPTPTTADAVEWELETYRRELTAYCYRMLGSGFEAEDAVQETLIRAWRGIDGFEGRSSLRSWLYRIATNVCLDMARGRRRRAMPMEMGPPSDAGGTLGATLTQTTWVLPVHDARVLPTDEDPAERVAVRESVRLAFVAALQHLPPRQRAVLILREVLRWQATEVAELLDTTVASVNSALQRARATLADLDLGTSPPAVDDGEQQALLARYVQAFEAYDVETLVALLKEDVTFTMPPWPLWLHDRHEVGRWFLGQGVGCKGSRLVPTAANGLPAFASYKPAGPGVWEPWSVQVLETSGGEITAIHNFLAFLDVELFAGFGLPPRLQG